MTNLEYLRTLEAKELAQAIKDVDECETCAYAEKPLCSGECSEGFREWLKQERNPKLKPCPFCGGEATIENFFDTYTIGCSNDSCLGFRALSFIYKDKAEAIEAWNKRAR